MAKKTAKGTPEGWRLTKKERTKFLLGDLGRTLEAGIIAAMMSTFMIFQGIDMTAIAGVMLVVKIIDAFDDMIFGYFVDRIKITEWKLFRKITGEGKYLPWYRLTFALFPVFTTLFFCMPFSWTETAKIIWFFVFYLLYDLSYTLVEVPMQSMIVTLTDNLDERNSILQAKTILSSVATFIVPLIWTAAISEFAGFAIRDVVLVSSVIFFFMMLPMCKGVKEYNTTLSRADSEESEKYTLKDMWNCVKTNKYLLILLLSTVINSCLQTGGALGTLVSYYHFGNSLAIAIPILIALVPVLLAQGQTRKLVKKFGKLQVFLICGIVSVLFRFVIYFVGPVFSIYCTLLVLQAPFDNVSNIAKSFFMPDTIEYARYKTGKDCTGICNALSSFVTKLTTSVSSSLGLFVLGLSNYIPVQAESFEDIAAAGVVQPQQAMDTMWVIFSLIPVIGMLLGILVMVIYKLKDRDVALMAKCNAGEITREECEAQLSRKY